ncbi:MAG: hypothetical protein F9B45_18580 [Phycisphaera sp. RhM]|nr:hypothetical protein [Phycisphaera sp. RhM]
MADENLFLGQMTEPADAVADAPIGHLTNPATVCDELAGEVPVPSAAKTPPMKDMASHRLAAWTTDGKSIPCPVR